MSDALKFVIALCKRLAGFCVALVRPIVTYWVVVLFSTAIIVGMSMAIDTGSDWKEVVLQSWTVEDMSMFSMIISFWFVSRSIAK